MLPFTLPPFLIKCQASFMDYIFVHAYLPIQYWQ